MATVDELTRALALLSEARRSLIDLGNDEAAKHVLSASRDVRKALRVVQASQRPPDMTEPDHGSAHATPPEDLASRQQAPAKARRAAKRARRLSHEPEGTNARAGDLASAAPALARAHGDADLWFEGVFRDWRPRTRRMLALRMDAAAVDRILERTFERAFPFRHAFAPMRPDEEARLGRWLTRIASAAERDMSANAYEVDVGDDEDVLVRFARGREILRRAVRELRGSEAS